MVRNDSTIMVSKLTLEKLKHMSKIFGKTETMLVTEFIDCMTELVTAVDKATYWLDNSSITNQIIYTIITEKSHLIKGRIIDPACLTDAENEILDETAMEDDIKARLLSQFPKKTEKVEVKQEIELKGDIGIPSIQKDMKIEGKVKKND